jgi:glutamate-1-semialdehyde aminotransferase
MTLKRAVTYRHAQTTPSPTSLAIRPVIVRRAHAMSKRNAPGLTADEVATMLAHAASSFEKLAAMNAAISELTNQPALARSLAQTAQELADDLAEAFGDYKQEYEAARAAGELEAVQA